MSIVKETKKFENQNFYENNMYLPVFPEFIDGEISSEDFIVATKQLVKTLGVSWCILCLILIY